MKTYMLIISTTSNFHKFTSYEIIHMYRKFVAYTDINEKNFLSSLTMSYAIIQGKRLFSVKPTNYPLVRDSAPGIGGVLRETKKFIPFSPVLSDINKQTVVADTDRPEVAGQEDSGVVPMGKSDKPPTIEKTGDIEKSNQSPLGVNFSAVKLTKSELNSLKRKKTPSASKELSQKKKKQVNSAKTAKSRGNIISKNKITIK